MYWAQVMGDALFCASSLQLGKKVFLLDLTLFWRMKPRKLVLTLNLPCKNKMALKMVTYWKKEEVEWNNILLLLQLTLLMIKKRDF